MDGTEAGGGADPGEPGRTGGIPGDGPDGPDGGAAEPGDGIDERRARRVAELARLALDDDELRGLSGDLGDILDHFRDLRDVEPRPGGRRPVLGDLSPRLRTDAPSSDALARGPGDLAPDWREGFFVVPRLSAMGPGEDGGE